MANNAAPKYRLDRHLPGNVRMFSRRNIGSGDEIIAERPLDRIEIGLEDTYNPDQVLDRINKFSASRHFENNRANLSHQNRNALDQLHMKDANDGLASIWATNAFQFQERRNGQTYTWLAVFNDISRANHSCQPNAVWTWNADRGMGTLYALETIANNNEITIEYMANPDQSLRTGVQRRKDLERHYGFECQCGACFVTEQGNTRRNHADGKKRNAAKRLLEQLQNFVRLPNESAAAAAVRKLNLGREYRDALQSLGIQDMKLANAFGELARLHEEAFDTATVPAHHANCGYCDGSRNGSGRIMHLERARKCLNEENGIHIRCWGTVYADLADDYSRQAAIQVKLNRSRQ